MRSDWVLCTGLQELLTMVCCEAQVAISSLTLNQGSSRHIHSTCGRRAPNVHALIAEKLKQYYKPSEDKPSRSYGRRLGEITPTSPSNVTRKSRPPRFAGTASPSSSAKEKVEGSESASGGSRFASEIEDPATATGPSIAATSFYAPPLAQENENPSTKVADEISSPPERSGVNAVAEKTITALKSNRFASENPPNESENAGTEASVTPAAGSTSSFPDQTDDSHSAQDRAKKSFKDAFADVRREDPTAKARLPKQTANSPSPRRRSNPTKSLGNLSNSARREASAETTPLNRTSSIDLDQSRFRENADRISKTPRTNKPARVATQQPFLDDPSKSLAKKPVNANQLFKLEKMDTPQSWYPDPSPKSVKSEVAGNRKGLLKESAKSQSHKTINTGRHEAVYQSLVNLYQVAQKIEDPTTREANLEAVEQVIEQTGNSIEDIKSRL